VLPCCDTALQSHYSVTVSDTMITVYEGCCCVCTRVWSLHVWGALWAGTENLVANPGFESWLPQADSMLTTTDAGSIPGWEVTLGSAWVLQSPSASGTLGISCQAAPFEGAAALALGNCPAVLCTGVAQACPGGAQEGKGVVVQQVNGTVPGQDYVVYLSVWASPRGAPFQPFLAHCPGRRGQPDIPPGACTQCLP